MAIQYDNIEGEYVWVTETGTSILVSQMTDKVLQGFISHVEAQLEHISGKEGTPASWRRRRLKLDLSILNNAQDYRKEKRKGDSMSLSKASKLMESLRSNERYKTHADGNILETLGIDLSPTVVSGSIFLDSIELEEEEELSKKLSVEDIDYVVLSDPATIVFFTDGTKEVVKTTDKDQYQPEIGVAMALMRKLFGSRSQYMKYIRDLVAEKKKEEEAKAKAKLPKIKVGDVVLFKEKPGVRMIVADILNHGMVECIWFEEEDKSMEDPFRENFHVDQLTVTK